MKNQFSSPAEILSTKASISVASSLTQNSRRYLKQKEYADQKVIKIIQKNVQIHNSVSMYQLGGANVSGGYSSHKRSGSSYQ